MCSSVSRSSPSGLNARSINRLRRSRRSSSLSAGVSAVGVVLRTECFTIPRVAPEHDENWIGERMLRVVRTGGRAARNCPLFDPEEDPMTISAVLDSAGRRRSPATLPGFHAGRPPRNKGMRYPADPRTPLVECRRARRASSARQPGRGATPVRATPATSCSRGRARSRGRTAEHHPTPARPCEPRNDIGLPSGHRHRGDHRRRPHKTGSDDVRHRRPAPLRLRGP